MNALICGIVLNAAVFGLGDAITYTAAIQWAEPGISGDVYYSLWLAVAGEVYWQQADGSWAEDQELVGVYLPERNSAYIIGDSAVWETEPLPGSFGIIVYNADRQLACYDSVEWGVK